MSQTNFAGDFENISETARFEAKRVARPFL